MPYTAKQNRLFWAAAKSKDVAAKVDIPQATAKRLAKEGVKRKPKSILAGSK